MLFFVKKGELLQLLIDAIFSTIPLLIFNKKFFHAKFLFVATLLTH